MKNGNIFIFGLVVGILMGMFVFWPASYQMGRDLDSHQTLVTDCEKNIPRSIRCILTAIPEEKK